jgi:hypothetical protein
MNYSELPYSTRKHWDLAYCDEVECAVAKDHLLFMFEIYDVQDILLEYPKGPEGWWWNDTHDRYIAEFAYEGFVTVNPMFVRRHFEEVVV